MNRALIVFAALAIAGAAIVLIGPAAAVVAGTAVLVAAALFSNSGASAAGVVCTACTTRCSCASRAAA
jgi:hypothetical protein